MGKRKASAKPVVTQASTASLLPRPTLVGAQKPTLKPVPEPVAAKQAAEEQADAKGPAPKHEPTLIGLPKHLPNALPRLKTTAKNVPQGRESSLVVLTRQIANRPRPQHKTGIRLKAPNPPPSAAASSASRRHAADPTDYDVQIIGAYATPPLPARVSTSPNADDVAWDDDVQLLDDSKRRNTIMGAAALAILCSVALAVCAYAMRTPDAKPIASAQPKTEVHVAPSTAAELPASAPATLPSAEPAALPQALSALSAAQIASPSQVEADPPKLVTKPTKLSKKALLRKRARARRARLNERVAQQ